jgi:hypothetical protein
MAVLVEGISVIVRKDSISKKLQGGEAAFRDMIPHGNVCDDEELERVGFTTPQETKEFVGKLTAAGLTFIEDEKCVDIVVCDQQRGPTIPCDWIEFGHLPFESGKIAAAWLFEGRRIGYGLHLPGTSLTFHTPGGWQFKGSLSEESYFLPNDSTMH